MFVHKRQDCCKNPPDSIALMAFALASSRAVTQRCLSTSLAALIWNVCVPPLDMTNVQESTVWMRAPCRLIVPRQVCAISAWFLQRKNLHKYQIAYTYISSIKLVCDSRNKNDRQMLACPICTVIKKMKMVLDWRKSTVLKKVCLHC